MPHNSKKASRTIIFPCFLALFDLSRFCFLGFYLGTQREICILSFHWLFTFHHTLLHSRQCGSKQSIRFHFVFVRSWWRASSHRSWPKQFSTRNLGRHTWISIFSWWLLCMALAQLNFHAFLVVFSFIHTHTQTHEGSAASFDPESCFFSQISLSNTIFSREIEDTVSSFTIKRKSIQHA